MQIKIGETTLASDTVADDSHSAPPSGVNVSMEATIQESRPIRSNRRRVFNRQNVGGVLIFTVRPRYSSLANAAAGAWTIGKRAGTAGVLSVKSHGGNDDAAANLTENANGKRAIVQKASARQIGVTVEANYEIVF